MVDSRRVKPEKPNEERRLPCTATAGLDLGCGGRWREAPPPIGVSGRQVRAYNRLTPQLIAETA